ncbi:TAP-like protein-domain-containing protein [Apiospora arundinis]|uniref:TAP-like protein-domain-containing protein n=1 Tax=Apiospora arundinis TaxID=335852 RepID=A0ABR2IX21_9PEZI
MTAVVCGDGESQSNLMTAGFADYVAGLQRRQNADFAFLEAQTTLAAEPRQVLGKPAAPILFVSSRYDPATPLANALAMVKVHPGSRVLIQEKAGHGSLFLPGRCREDYIKKYLATGKLPPGGTPYDVSLHLKLLELGDSRKRHVDLTNLENLC